VQSDIVAFSAWNRLVPKKFHRCALRDRGRDIYERVANYYEAGSEERVSRPSCGEDTEVDVQDREFRKRRGDAVDHRGPECGKFEGCGAGTARFLRKSNELY
jgi:hypothetical protein